MRLTRYVCPTLMWIQFAVMRVWPFGHPVRVMNGTVVRVMPKGHGVTARAWWPRWMILAECRFWNSRAGMTVRGWLAKERDDV